MKKLFFNLGIGVLTIYLAVLLIPGVKIEGDFMMVLKISFWAGIILGLINYFFKPLIKLITLPLAILTLGLFWLIINILIIWVVDIVFQPLIILGLWPLFLTSLLNWGLSLLLSRIIK